MSMEMITPPQLHHRMLVRVTYYDGQDSALEIKSAGENQAVSFLLLLLPFFSYEWSQWKEGRKPSTLFFS